MARYMKKPVVVEAVCILGDDDLRGTFSETPEWLEKALDAGVLMPSESSPGDWSISTQEGVMRAKVGSYIVRGVNGELYAVDGEIFHKTYNLVEDC